MTRAPRRPAGWAGDEGSSLAEVAVAMAVLVVVVVPTALAAVALLQSAAPGDRARALVRATTAVEQTLAAPPDLWRSGTEADGPWRVRRMVTRDGDYASVRVEVSRGDRPPLVTLVAGRTPPAASGVTDGAPPGDDVSPAP